MELNRHKTLKKYSADVIDVNIKSNDSFKNRLDDSAREAYSRPWHRLERGLRLNRIRLFIDDTMKEHNMTQQEKDDLFVFLQKAHDKKLLNTIKVVQYDIETTKIISIKGLEIKRNDGGDLQWEISVKLSRSDSTRKKKKDEDEL
jgi:hypothetical protein